MFPSQKLFFPRTKLSVPKYLPNSKIFYGGIFTEIRFLNGNSFSESPPRFYVLPIFKKSFEFAKFKKKKNSFAIFHSSQNIFRKCKTSFPSP